MFLLGRRSFVIVLSTVSLWLCTGGLTYAANEIGPLALPSKSSASECVMATLGTLAIASHNEKALDLSQPGNAFFFYLKSQGLTYGDARKLAAEFLHGYNLGDRRNSLSNKVVNSQALLSHREPEGLKLGHLDHVEAMMDTILELKVNSAYDARRARVIVDELLEILASLGEDLSLKIDEPFQNFQRYRQLLSYLPENARLPKIREHILVDKLPATIGLDEVALLLDPNVIPVRDHDQLYQLLKDRCFGELSMFTSSENNIRNLFQKSKWRTFLAKPTTHNHPTPEPAVAAQETKNEHGSPGELNSTATKDQEPETPKGAIAGPASPSSIHATTVLAQMEQVVASYDRERSQISNLARQQHAKLVAERDRLVQEEVAEETALIQTIRDLKKKIKDVKYFKWIRTSELALQLEEKKVSLSRMREKRYSASNHIYYTENSYEVRLWSNSDRLTWIRYQNDISAEEKKFYTEPDFSSENLSTLSQKVHELDPDFQIWRILHREASQNEDGNFAVRNPDLIRKIIERLTPALTDLGISPKELSPKNFHSFQVGMYDQEKDFYPRTLHHYLTYAGKSYLISREENRCVEIPGNDPKNLIASYIRFEQRLPHLADKVASFHATLEKYNSNPSFTPLTTYFKQLLPTALGTLGAQTLFSFQPGDETRVRVPTAKEINSGQVVYGLAQSESPVKVKLDQWFRTQSEDIQKIFFAYPSFVGSIAKLDSAAIERFKRRFTADRLLVPFNNGDSLVLDLSGIVAEDVPYRFSVGFLAEHPNTKPGSGWVEILRDHDGEKFSNGGDIHFDNGRLILRYPGGAQTHALYSLSQSDFPYLSLVAHMFPAEIEKLGGDINPDPREAMFLLVRAKKNAESGTAEDKWNPEDWHAIVTFPHSFNPALKIVFDLKTYRVSKFTQAQIAARYDQNAIVPSSTYSGPQPLRLPLYGSE